MLDKSATDPLDAYLQPNLQSIRPNQASRRAKGSCVQSTALLSSEINSVTVYCSGARITRGAALERKDGTWPDRIRLTGLPLVLDDASVVARVERRENGSRGDFPAASDVRVVLN